MSALFILTTNYSRELPRYIYYKSKQFHVLIILSKLIYYDIWFPHELKLELFNHRVCVFVVVAADITVAVVLARSFVRLRLFAVHLFYLMVSLSACLYYM